MSKGVTCTSIIPESRLNRVGSEFSPRKKYFDDSSTAYESTSSPIDCNESITTARFGGSITTRTTSRGMHTSRTSVTDLLQLASTGDHCNSLRDMIHNIQIKADLGEAPPSYVFPLNELPSNCVSWNGKLRNIPVIQSPGLNRSKSLYNISKNVVSRSSSPSGYREIHMETTIRFDLVNTTDDNAENIPANKIPVINNIGCNRPLELILSRADARYRKHINVKQALECNIQEENASLLQGILPSAAQPYSLKPQPAFPDYYPLSF